MLTGANNLDRSELRRRPRYLTPILEIIVGCELFRTIDWSLGGVHLDGVCEGIPVGTAVEGWIGQADMRQAFGFTAEIVRTDRMTGNTVLRFDEIEVGTAEFLDRSIIQRLH